MGKKFVEMATQVEEGKSLITSMEEENICLRDQSGGGRGADNGRVDGDGRGLEEM